MVELNGAAGDTLPERRDLRPGLFCTNRKDACASKLSSCQDYCCTVKVYVHESTTNLTSYEGQEPEPLSASLSMAGVEVVDALSQDACLIVVDHSPKVLRKARRLGISRDACVLVQSEPRVVYPHQYDESVTSGYGLVCQVGRVDGANLLWPQNLPSSSSDWEKGPEDRRPGVFIATDRQSPIDSRTYELRRALVPHLLERGFSVRGNGWSDRWPRRLVFRSRLALWTFRQRRIPNLRSHYRGVFAPRFQDITPISRSDKLRYLSRFRVSVVVENSNEYLSEKLFDALSAGTLPIYVGPPLTDYGIPQNLALEVQPEICAVLNAVDSITIEDIKRFQSFLGDWSTSPAAERHSRGQFVRQLIERLSADWKPV